MNEEERPITVKPRYNEGPRDWQNVCAITRFRYMITLSFFFICFTILGVKKIVRYTDDFVVISRFRCIIRLCSDEEKH